MVIPHDKHRLQGRNEKWHRVKPFHQQYMVVCIHPHSHGVIQGGWLSVRPPIQRINAHVRRRQHRAHRPRLCHRVITNHHPRIRGILRSTQCRACCQLLVTDFITYGIRRHHSPVNLLRHPLHQFHHRLTFTSAMAYGKRASTVSSPSIHDSKEICL